jgi:chromate transporter
LKFTAPLLAITAAVVGVVVNLAVFFAYHVWWPSGFSDQFDWVAASISALALIALFRFKRSIMQVLGVAALVGVILTLLNMN